MLDHVHPYQFRRNSPFYPLVTNYVVLLAGFKEFAAAGIALTLKDLPDTEAEKALSGAENKGNAHIVRRLMDANPSELRRIGRRHGRSVPASTRSCSARVPDRSRLDSRDSTPAR